MCAHRASLSNGIRVVVEVVAMIIAWNSGDVFNSLRDQRRPIPFSSYHGCGKLFAFFRVSAGRVVEKFPKAGNILLQLMQYKIRSITSEIL